MSDEASDNPPDQEAAPKKGYRMPLHQWLEHSRWMLGHLEATQSNEASQQAIAQRFRDYYPDEDEAMHKCWRFWSSLVFYTTNREALEQAGLAVIGSETTGDLLQPKLVKGLYHWFGLVPIATPFSMPTVEQIVSLAQAYEPKTNEGNG